MTSVSDEGSIEHIVETFEFLDDWDSRYQYLIELGENLPRFPEQLKNDQNWVKPCMSKVHVVAQSDPAQPELIFFSGDCDTAIIKGVLAVLIDLFSYHTLEEIQHLDVERVFKRLRLEEHLSPNRHVGIYAIVEKMVERATTLMTAEPLLSR
jgi:cysteine desulfuration protein SufE